MTGKGLARLALLVLVAIVGAGMTLGAMNKPLLAGVAVEQAAASPAEGERQ